MTADPDEVAADRASVAKAARADMVAAVDPFLVEGPLQEALHDYLTPHPELGQDVDERGCVSCFLIARAIAPAAAAALLPVVDAMRWDAIAAWLHPDTNAVPCTWCHAQPGQDCTGPDLAPGHAHGCRADDARALLAETWKLREAAHAD